MPKFKGTEVELYYEIYGEGEPLVLIEGLSYSSWMWFKQIPALSKYFKLIVFDNRGVGESDKPKEPYTTSMMARDVRDLMNGLGIQKAHILGVSMGGLIAQQFAIEYPQMVNKLVLVCTGHNGPNAVMPSQEVLELLARPKGNTPEERVRYAIEFITTEKNRREKPDVIEEIIEQQLSNKIPPYAYNNQLHACATHNSEEQLCKIKQPTLIIFGDSDQIFPIGNAHRLHNKIAGSELVILENGGHLFLIECAAEFNKAVIEFLQK